MIQTAVTYERVSTLEQSNKRFSIESQRNAITQFCANRNISVLASFQDASTGTKFDRDGFNQLKEYCKKRKPSYILVWRWDRLGRNAVEMLTTVREFQKLGIEINAVEQWKESNKADDMFMLGLQAILAERESAVTSERIRMNMVRANEQGIWLNKLPLGYRRSNMLDEKGKRAVEVCPIGSVIVKEVYDLFLSDWDKMRIRTHIIDKYKDDLKKIKYSFVLMAVRRILTNVFYTGMMEYKDMENIERTVKGIHEPIIDVSTFEQAQKRIQLLENVHSKAEHVERDEYPLKGLVRCQTCHVPLRAYKVKKNLKNGNVQLIHYYDCKHNHFRIQTKDAHDIVLQAVKELSFSKTQMDEVQKDLTKITQAHNLTKNLKVSEATRTIEASIEKIRKLDDLLLSGLSIEDYNRLKKQYQATIEEAELSVAAVSDFIDTQKAIMKKVMTIVFDMDNLYERANGGMKKRLLKAMFPEGIFLDKTEKRVLTQYINSFFAAMRLKSSSYKKIHLIELDGLSYCSPKESKIEPKKRDTAFEMKLINSIFV